MTSESESSSNVSEAVTASARSIAALRALEHARGCGTQIFEDACARALAGEAYARVVAKAKARRASSRGAEGDEEEEEEDARVWCVDDGASGHSDAILRRRVRAVDARDGGDDEREDATADCAFRCWVRFEVLETRRERERGRDFDGVQ